MATPPCQGFSLVGKNKNQEQILADKQNFLIFKVIELIDNLNLDFILIENVPRFIKVLFSYEGKYKTLVEILTDKYSSEYNIDWNILNAKDYGVPQSRPRAIIKIYKKGLVWPRPEKQEEITLRKAISHLPSLESGEKSNIKWHNAKIHSPNHIKWMKNTRTGCSAFKNVEHYPKKENGVKIKGYPATYSRMNWGMFQLLH